jgi:hypothetical protein
MMMKRSHKENKGDKGAKPEIVGFLVFSSPLGDRNMKEKHLSCSMSPYNSEGSG